MASHKDDMAHDYATKVLHGRLVSAVMALSSMGHCTESFVWDLAATLVLFCYGRCLNDVQYSATACPQAICKCWRYAARRNKLLSTYEKSPDDVKSRIYTGLACRVAVQRTRQDAMANLHGGSKSVLSQLASTTAEPKAVELPEIESADIFGTTETHIYAEALWAACHRSGLGEVANTIVGCEMGSKDPAFLGLIPACQLDQQDVITFTIFYLPFSFPPCIMYSHTFNLNVSLSQFPTHANVYKTVTQILSNSKCTTNYVNRLVF